MGVTRLAALRMDGRLWELVRETEVSALVLRARLVAVEVQGRLTEGKILCLLAFVV